VIERTMMPSSARRFLYSNNNRMNHEEIFVGLDVEVTL
jgi:hypothetical protein